MDQAKNIQAQISHYAAEFSLRHFGEAPTAIKVAVQHPFVTIHLLGFLLPQEKMLLKQKKGLLVHETRDLLMKSLTHEFTGQLAELLAFSISELI